MNNSKLLFSTVVLIVVLGGMAYQLFQISGQMKLTNFAPTAGPKNPLIKLRVTGGTADPKLKINEGPACINPGNPGLAPKGCVTAKKGIFEKITYRFDGSPDWKFTRMQLVAGSNALKIDFAKPGGFQTQYRSDFLVVIGDDFNHPDKNGIIDLNGVTEFVLQDMNNVKQTYTYQIEACKAGTCLMTDPKIINEG